MDNGLKIKKADEKHGHSNPVVIILLAVMLAVVLGVVDYMAGPNMSLLIFYLVPVAMAAWYSGRIAGMVVLGVSIVEWFIEDIIISCSNTAAFAPYWRILSNILLFIFVIVMLGRLKRALRSEALLARLDPLTGIANRRYFFELAADEMSRATRYKHKLTVAYLDIDDFKLINDRFGHKVGDSLLRVMAFSLKKSIRTTDILARLGGDEFVILFTETDFESSEVALNRIHSNLSSAMQMNNWPATFSVGALTCEGTSCNIDKLIAGADSLMYSVKKAGKNMTKHESI